MDGVTTTEFLLDVLRRRTYRGLSPERIPQLAAEALAGGADGDAVTTLASLFDPATTGDQALKAAIDESFPFDPTAVARRIEAQIVCAEITTGARTPMDGGARLDRLFREDETNTELAPFLSLMAESDDLDYRPELERQLLARAKAYIGLPETGPGEAFPQ